MRNGRRRLTARFANGVVSALIVVFFLAHGTLGALEPYTGFKSPLAWVVWGGVALIGVHVIMSAVTSAQQLNDVERPPSARKKRHLALKWATGLVLALAACGHVVAVRTLGPASMHAQVLGVVSIAIVAAALAVHVSVGSKSLLKDLGISRRHKVAVRVVVCAFAFAFAALTLVAAMM